MATLVNNQPTLLDAVKAMDPDGNVATVVEMLAQTNEILADAVYLEGNQATGHVTTVRTGIPEGTWRRLYGVVQPSKSTREQVTDTVGMLEDYDQVDCAVAELNANVNEFRLSEAQATLEGMSQNLAETMIYGDTSINPERFDGLAPRFNDLSAENRDNIIDAGGTGVDNRSIWLVGWGANTCHAIYPKGSTGGIMMDDKGKVTAENINGQIGLMEVYRTHFKATAGLCVRDWRYVVRIANIDKSDLSPDASSGANLPNLMFQALELVPSLDAARFAFYMSRDVRTIFRQQYANGTSQSTLPLENVGGVRSPTFQEIPVRRVDRLATDEARVV